MSNSPLSKRLRALRGTMEVNELSQKTGVGRAAIYKAESGDPVRWSTLEAAYGQLCKRDEDYMDLLMLWAMQQSGRQVSLGAATEAMRKVREEASDSLEKWASRVARATEGMTPPEQQVFLEFATLFRKDAAVRRMIEAYLESSRKWA